MEFLKSYIGYIRIDNNRIDITKAKTHIPGLGTCVFILFDCSGFVFAFCFTQRSNKLLIQLR